MTDPTTQVPATAPMIDLQGVGKKYRTKRGEVQAIEDLDLQIPEGQFVSLLGPSGCGKSTLLMCVAGLERQTRGEIRVSGNPVDGPNRDFGIVFQNAELLEWRTTLDNILLQVTTRGLKRGEYVDRAMALLEQVGLAGFADKYPHELSGGMQQRVALCRALIHDPDLLLMDEPFGALDSLTRDQMNSDLQRLWMDRGKTVLFVTHSIEEAVFLGDRVLVFSPRPARVALDLAVGLPRPRRQLDRTNADFAHHVEQVRDVFAELGVLRVED